MAPKGEALLPRGWLARVPCRVSLTVLCLQVMAFSGVGILVSSGTHPQLQCQLLALTRVMPVQISVGYMDPVRAVVFLRLVCVEL